MIRISAVVIDSMAFDIWLTGPHVKGQKLSEITEKIRFIINVKCFRISSHASLPT